MNNSIFYGYGGLLLIYLALIILFKVFASSATNGGGGCGGIFAPSLFWDVSPDLSLPISAMNFIWVRIFRKRILHCWGWQD